jgi:hypothetical protein
MVDSMEEVWRELEDVYHLTDNDEIKMKVQRALNYLYMVEERL